MDDSDFELKLKVSSCKLRYLFLQCYIDIFGTVCVEDLGDASIFVVSVDELALVEVGQVRFAEEDEVRFRCEHLLLEVHVATTERNLGTSQGKLYNHFPIFPFSKWRMIVNV